MNKLLSITQLLITKPTLSELTLFLSLKNCPSGEISSVYFAKISSDRTMTIETAAGFNDKSTFIGKVIPIESDRPSGRSILEDQIFFEINSPDYLRKYPGIAQEAKSEAWNSQISMPINSQYFMQCGRYANMNDDDPLFYQNLQSLLRIHFSRITKPIRDGNLYGKELTQRQAEIYQLMLAKNTNDEIAELIGFSASLVKQETIIIFSKLGLSGRKDLT
jgi:DNA-binding CsgD family transcriptional regulator